MARESWWLDDWALYAALADATGTPDWRDWPEPIRDRHPRAMDDVRAHLSWPMLRHQYLQWQAELQWQGARMLARGEGVTRVRRHAVHGVRAQPRRVGAPG